MPSKGQSPGESKDLAQSSARSSGSGPPCPAHSPTRLPARSLTNRPARPLCHSPIPRRPGAARSRSLAHTLAHPVWDRPVPLTRPLACQPARSPTGQLARALTRPLADALGQPGPARLPTPSPICPGAARSRTLVHSQAGRPARSPASPPAHSGSLACSPTLWGRPEQLSRPLVGQPARSLACQAACSLASTPHGATFLTCPSRITAAGSSGYIARLQIELIGNCTHITAAMSSILELLKEQTLPVSIAWCGRKPTSRLPRTVASLRDNVLVVLKRCVYRTDNFMFESTFNANISCVQWTSHSGKGTRSSPAPSGLPGAGCKQCSRSSPAQGAGEDWRRLQAVRTRQRTGHALFASAKRGCLAKIVSSALAPHQRQARCWRRLRAEGTRSSPAPSGADWLRL
jgi:hypothetical protein